MPDEFRLPFADEHHAIVGRTGTGKTRLGGWVLSKNPFWDFNPYYIVDYKYEELFRAIPKIREIGLNEWPEHPGLYIVHPRRGRDDEAVNYWLEGIWQRENTGLFIDETYMLPNKDDAFQDLLTQGRSKRIPITAGMQRPKFVSKFVFSEMTHFSVFDLNAEDDRKTIRGYIPEAVADARLQPYHSLWYNLKSNRLDVLAPVPPVEEIVEAISARLPDRKRVL